VTLEDAWDAVGAAPSGWWVGRPMYHDERRERQLPAFDPSERPKVGFRSREWTAIADSEEAAVWEMGRCLAIICEGGWPG
jgi:hypothetical protein